MSQTAESARDWINSASPTPEQLQNAAMAIERKLEAHPSLDDDSRQNLTGALAVVTAELQAQRYAEEDEVENPLLPSSNPIETEIDASALGNNPAIGNNLDTAELGENADPCVRALQGDAKKAAFAALKKKLQQ